MGHLRAAQAGQLLRFVHSGGRHAQHAHRRRERFVHKTGKARRVDACEAHRGELGEPFCRSQPGNGCARFALQIALQKESLAVFCRRLLL
jgi:hypothetical protein